MKDRKILFTVVWVVIIAILLALISIQYLLSLKSPFIELNVEKIECYESALSYIFNDANITADELDVHKVQCSQETIYNQYEITGIYFRNGDHSKEP